MSALPDRYWSKVDKTDDCWLWTAAVDRDGYASYTESRSKKWRAHRLAYLDAYGPHDEGLELDHLCTTRQCVRPDHLEAVTHAENLRRAAARRLKDTSARGLPRAG